MNKHVFNIASKRKVILLSVAFFAGLSFFNSCKKVESDLGKGVQSNDDELGIKKTDTFSIITYSKLQDSVVTGQKGVQLLGSYVDPVFGTVKASFATQLRLQGNNPNFGTLGLEVDSFVLSLDYNSVYGREDEQTFKVFKLNTTVKSDDTLYNFTVPDFDPTDLVEAGQNNITPSTTDSVLVGNSMKPAQLRIRLDKTIAEDIINAASSGNLANDETFIDYFPGLYITTENTQSTGEGGIFSFSVGNLNSKLTIYFHDNDNPSKTFNFTMGTNTGRYNRVEYNNNMTAVFNQYDSDSTSGMTSFYTQSGLVEARVFFPTFENLKAQNIAINKADLELPVEYFDGDPYEPPFTMTIFADNEGENEVITTDVAQYDSKNKNYSVDLTWHLQRVQTGEVTNKELFLIPNQFFTGTERVIFNGPNTPFKNLPKLIVTYTEF